MREEAVDPFANLAEQRLHRREPALFVLAAVLGEPFAPLVAREGTEESPFAVGEALEASRCRARAVRHGGRQYVGANAGANPAGRSPWDPSGQQR